MITISGLNVAYGQSKQVLSNLNLELELGAIHGIVGLNGAGKTTLLDTIFGLRTSSSGSISYNGKRLTKLDISYLTAENFFYSYITGREYLAMFKSETAFDVEKWNQLFALPLDKEIDEYSTGMKKKLAFFAIMKQNKPIMILDEPFNGLDVESCRILRLVLLRLKEQGTTILVTSHIIETLTNLCDRIHYLEAGAIKTNVDRSGFANFQNNLYENIERQSKDLIDDLL